MTSQRLEYTGFRFGLCPGADHRGSARGRWGFPGTSGFASVGQFGPGYGACQGFSRVGYGHVEREML